MIEDPIERSREWVVWLLALMLLLVPAFGANPWGWTPETPKSILISIFSLSAAFVFFWSQRNKMADVSMHSLLILPLSLALYALGSMAWSHTYLAGGEAIRWLLFSVVFCLGLNTLTLARTIHLAWGIHIGAVLASLWAVLQFWVDLQFFPQAVAPASTFGNRNVFAEFVVCTLPFSVWLLTQLRSQRLIFCLTASVGLNVVALFMTGTRSALVGLFILAVLLPVLVWRYRHQAASGHWGRVHRVALGALFIGTVLGLGAIDSGNPALTAERGPGDAIDHAFGRSQSIVESDEYRKGSFSFRIQMWRSTGRMMLANPLWGVGAGSWEAQVPLYQAAGAQLESDSYAHNELLQLLSEYGLVGWLFLLALLTYLAWAACRTWSDKREAVAAELPLRAFVLSSLLVMLLVSNAGFPWHMAGTSALFAISLALLAASDVRLGNGPPFLWQTVKLKSGFAYGALGATIVGAVVAFYFSWQALLCESFLKQAIERSHQVIQSGNPDHPRWNETKAEVLRLADKGIAINAHYSFATAVLAENVIRWGDWENAIWIMKSVMASRPNEVALLVAVSRGYLTIGNLEQSRAWFNRAASVQPTAPYVRVQQAFLLLEQGDAPSAARIIAERLDANGADRDLINAAHILGRQSKDWRLTIRALEQQIKKAPELAQEAWLDLAAIYSNADVNDEAKAIESYRTALNLTPGYLKNRVWQQIPPAWRFRLQR